MDSSTPSLTEFNPRYIPFQLRVIQDVKKNFDYSLGVHEILCSGAVGSAKSLLGAHLAITHCLQNPGAQFLIGRRTMPTLKDTILKKIIEHLSMDVPYKRNLQRGIITFKNGSQLIPYSWADGNTKKVRSLELSGALIEELTENDEQEFYDEIKMRVGRLSHVKEKIIISLTNPDDPSHWAHKYFIESDSPTRHVYYSLTHQNPFLPPSYVSQLEDDLDPKMARRMLYGEWLSLTQDVVYYAYAKEKNFINTNYKVDERFPIHMSFDFNIGEGKPMSLCFAQYIGGAFHFFAEVVVHGARTQSIMEEAGARGFLDYPCLYYVNGDATGKHRDTRSKHSDYELIKIFLDNYKNPKGQYIKYEIDVPLANPKVRDRHNKMNALCENSKGVRSFYVYAGAKTLDEGMRLTKLKPGGKYIEDDSKAYQHITTAAGYLVDAATKKSEVRKISMIAR